MRPVFISKILYQLLDDVVMNEINGVTYNRTDTSVLHIFLKDTSFRSLTKNEFIGFTEFLCIKFHLSWFFYYYILFIVLFIFIFKLIPEDFLVYLWDLVSYHWLKFYIFSQYDRIMYTKEKLIDTISCLRWWVMYIIKRFVITF